MSRLIYNIGILLYTAAIRLSATFYGKTRLMVQGWRATWQNLRQIPHDNTSRAWFHVSSLGEFEQARPVLEQYRRLHPDHFILLTFFSPSGYEVRKNYNGADMVCYLPMDTPRNARRFLQAVNPTVVYFVKYDFWFNLMIETKRCGSKLYIFSAIFRRSQYFFKPYGRWFLHQLCNFDHIFVQNSQSEQLLRSHGIDRCSLAPDTRFDRVAEIAANVQPSAIVDNIIATYPQRPGIIVAGSTWEPDEKLLSQYLQRHNSTPLLLIIAPHVVEEHRINQVERLFGNENCIRYSQTQKEEPSKYTHRRAQSQQQILIIDNYGLLSTLYQYADVVYIGGGFGHGIHNILEAITFGKPVCFGPRYTKFQEAHDIIQLGGGMSITNADSLTAQFDCWLTDNNAYGQASDACHQYIKDHQGGRDKIITLTANPAKPTAPHILQNSLITLIPAILATILATSCSVNKFIGPDDQLLYSNHYNVEMSDGTKPPDEIADVLKGLKNYAAQKPNKKFLGVRWGMRVYCLSSPTDTNWFQNYLRRNGQSPVVYDENATRRTAAQLQSLMLTKGCFSSTVEYDTIVSRRGVSVNYRLHPSPRYLVNEITYNIPEQEILALVKEKEKDSYLKTGQYYDQDLVARERDRIVQDLLEAGYYRASPSLVTFLIDTNFTPGRASIEIAVNKNSTATGLTLRKYRIGNIAIYNGFGTQPYQTTQTELLFDTVIYNTTFRNRQLQYTILTPNETSKDKRIKKSPKQVSPTVICRNMMLFSGQPYHPANRSRTYNSLLALRNFRFIDIDFAESTTPSDTVPTVDARIRLLQSPRQKISASLEVNNSSPFGTQTGNATTFLGGGNFGLETVLEYQNRNLFGGAELLKVDASLLVELPKLILSQGATQFHDAFSAFESGLDLSLDLPQFLLPFTRNIMFQRMRPHTILALGASYQYRTYFERMLANTSFGYNWSSTARVRNQLLPLEFTFVKFLNKNEAFVSRLESISDLRLKYQYSDHLIMNSRYDLIYNGQQGRRVNFSYLHLTLETAGNMLQATSTLLGGPVDENGIRQLFGIPYAQYIRVNADTKHYFYLSDGNTFVTRLLLGIGIPYANSLSMPYEKSFFGGGPTTMRAWQLRHLGPGLYSNEQNPMAERVGDISLVLNLEDRFHIASIFEGAIFADIGNVWLTHENTEFVGGKIQADNFLPSLAVGTGMGLRLKISFITLRLDLAIPLYDPGYESSHRWRPPYWKISQVVTNLGIDYPF